VVGRDGVATDPEKVRAVRYWAVPVDLPGLQAFLGLVGYYRQYIPNFAGIAQPLNRLTAKGVRWQWTQAKQQAFNHLKDRLVEAPILAYPDPVREYILDTDASNHNVGAVLPQVQDGREVVVSAPEKNYCTTRRELLAVVKAVKHFRPYLYGRTFRLRTDHASLIWLCRRAEFKYFCDRWDSLRFNGDELLTIMLAAGTNSRERERVVCPSALRRKLI